MYLQGWFTFLNSAIRSLGYEPEDLIGRRFGAIGFPREADDRRTTGLEVRLLVSGRSPADPAT